MNMVKHAALESIEYEELLDVYHNYTPDKQAADVSPETRALADVCLLLFNSNAFIYVY